MLLVVGVGELLERIGSQVVQFFGGSVMEARNDRCGDRVIFRPLQPAAPVGVAIDRLAAVNV